LSRQQPPRSSAAAPAAGSVRPATAQSRYGNGFLAERLARRDVSPPPPDGSQASVDPASRATTPDAPAADTTAGTTTTADAGAVATGPATAPVAAAPLKLPNPLPAVAGEQRRECLGVQIIGNDVSPTALDACEAFVKLTLSARKDIQERLKKEQVALVILPRNKKMTDAPQFASLKGTKTFDGRMWDDVRGSGGMRVAGGLWAIAVPEENLIAAEPDTDKYSSGYSVGLHEFAHTVHSKGVSDTERKTIRGLYEARKKAGGPWTEAYGASNEQEYYAQCTTCFFGANEGIGQNGAAWLLANDKPMYDFLVSVYGPPPSRATSPGNGKAGTGVASAPIDEAVPDPATA
jgi:hypothetical protein